MTRQQARENVLVLGELRAALKRALQGSGSYVAEVPGPIAERLRELIADVDRAADDAEKAWKEMGGWGP